MYKYVKRVVDIMLVLLSAPLWLPVFCVVAVLVKLTSHGPVFFLQKRFGQGRRFFQIYKFRSMYVDAPKDVPTHLLKDPAALITPVGRVIRRLSLDELPQLFNILRGELSIVGPRPALWNQDDLIAEREKYGANDVPAGLTGLAQVSGRDELPIAVKAAYDGEYVQKMGFFYDIWIILRTVGAAFAGSGVKEGGSANG